MKLSNMASPLLSSFCCEFRENSSLNSKCHGSSLTEQLHLDQAAMSYNILCIISSIIGIGGAIYQLKLRLQVGWRSQTFILPEVIDRQSKIIFWLAAADGLASLGILCRSCVWLIGMPDPKSDDLFCAISAGWIQYFYICTYFWTIMFAFDTYKNAANKNRCSMQYYHVVSWLVSLLLCVGGLAVLYYPGLSSCGSSDLLHRLPHFLASYIPILCVMVINPVFFCCSSHLVKKDLEQRGSSLIEQKQIMREVMCTFRSVVLIFYACWLPNVINGIWVLSRGSKWQNEQKCDIEAHNNLGHSVAVALWQVMALLNPIQGFLNSIVYTSIARWPGTQMIHFRRRSSATPSAIENPAAMPVEEDPHSSASSFNGETQWAQERTETSPLLLFK